MKEIDGFYYPFAKALLQKLKKLKEEGRVMIKTPSHPDSALIAESIGFFIVRSLVRQLNGGRDLVSEDGFGFNDLEQLIKSGEEFLEMVEGIDE